MLKKGTANQTKALRAATLQLLNRNEPVKKCFEKVVKEKESSIPREVLERALIRPAAIGYRFLSRDDFDNGKAVECDSMFYDEREMCDPDKVLRLLTSGKPEESLLIGVDLTRSKESIMAEFETLLDLQRQPKKDRLKWLSTVKEILAVWDLWVDSGKPARQAFPEIAKKLNESESTVKARWRRAYELIYRKPYETDPTKKREQVSDEAIKLCGACKDQGKCYKIIDDVMEFLPCPAYLKLNGKGYMREKLYGNIEKIMSKSAYDDFAEIAD